MIDLWKIHSLTQKITNVEWTLIFQPLFPASMSSIYPIISHLVGGLEHEFYYFPYIGIFIIPTDELIFFRGVGIPPTSHYSIINIYPNISPE